MGLRIPRHSHIFDSPQRQRLCDLPSYVCLCDSLLALPVSASNDVLRCLRLACRTSSPRSTSSSAWKRHASPATGRPCSPIRTFVFTVTMAHLFNLIGRVAFAALFLMSSYQAYQNFDGIVQVRRQDAKTACSGPLRICTHL